MALQTIQHGQPNWDTPINDMFNVHFGKSKKGGKFMLKTVYRWDPTTNYQTSQENVADDYQLKANETFDKPERIDKSTVKRVGNQWVQLTDAEDAAYKKAHYMPMPGIPKNPNSADKAVNALGQQVAMLTAENQQLKAAVKSGNEATQQLGMQLATLIAKNATTQNGGNQ